MYNLTTSFIHNMYSGDDFGSSRRNGIPVGVLPHHAVDNDTEHDGFDSYLIDVLGDLEEMKKKSSKRRSGIDGCVYIP